MALPTQTPPLLLTKRLTAFLQSNVTPDLPTLLLATPSGKLLAHASPHPVSHLRTQSTVAASLLSINTLGGAAADALSTTSTAQDSEDGRRAVITVSLETGTVVMRRLKCGLLFVCVGPQTEQPEQAQHQQQHQQQQLGESADNGDETTAATPASGEERDGEASGDELQRSGHDQVAVAAMKSRMRDLARSLDDKLGTLAVPIEGVGGE
ncbi:hypothetical protein N3K66_004961 [Trichothecium roseum]|uniref:Uncharacterized protein n=1 Tax=Trichothecium roseum TaxID=47278 RepID=A0ACC0V2M5_9HYPO|nr:hypothetical protein N3K66_004961 [Trichothecium roseum]